MSRLEDLIDYLCHSPMTTPAMMVKRGRVRARRLGLDCNPVGTANKKTCVPSTYRPVGPTCPPCPYDETCYARHGTVRWQQKRASDQSLPSLVSAAIAIVAAARHKILARLHVSGDVFCDGTVDAIYVYGLAEIARHVREKLGITSEVAWTYTHAPPSVFELYRLLLEGAGICVLYSDHVQPGGAVVWPFDDLETLRGQHPDALLVKCREQLDGTPCRWCGLCWRARADGLTIVFDPHGGGAKALRASLSPNEMQEAS